MINSKGKAFHSKLPEIDGVSSGFDFSEDDEISITVDFQGKYVHFLKKGMLKKNYSMELVLDDKYLYNLRPVVVFAG